MTTVGSDLRTIHDLWMNADNDGKVLRKFAVASNNAFAFASQTMKSASVPGDGWKPTVVIQGCCYHNIGPIVPQGGSTACRNIQVYTLDEQHERDATSVRFGNIDFKRGTITVAEKATLTRVWDTIDAAMKGATGSPLVQDFLALKDMSEDEVGTGSFVLRADARPDGEHERRYNRPEGFKEITMLIDDDAGRATERDIVVHKKVPAGESIIMRIKPTHRLFDALHYVLIFPGAEDGWTFDMRALAPRAGKKVTQRDFYAYQLHERKYDGVHPPVPVANIRFLLNCERSHRHSLVSAGFGLRSTRSTRTVQYTYYRRCVLLTDRHTVVSPRNRRGPVLRLDTAARDHYR